MKYLNWERKRNLTKLNLNKIRNYLVEFIHNKKIKDLLTIFNDVLCFTGNLQVIDLIDMVQTVTIEVKKTHLT